MDNSSLLSKILAKIGIAILAVALFDLVYLNYLTFKNEGAKQEARTVDLKPTPAPTPSPLPSPQTTGSQVSSTPPANNAGQQTIVQTAQKEIFIPVGSGSTNSRTYANIPGAEVTIDSSKYAGIQSVNFEANVSVTGGNGKAYVQLYNKTGGHPVWNSELATTSGTGILLVSPGVSLDPGQNTYIIQAKTDITDWSANVSTGRIKIVLK
ncbi:MAG: hypothetical protein Q7S45_02755 [Candidatus Curtissbacteria bacterium]|nr:hypothetical protein [Candidatus Curtissbacteria bacterium]